MDFNDYDIYRGRDTKYYWGFGVGLSVFVMTVAITFIVTEYCTQSHLSSEDYQDAINGLKATRWFKKHTLWVRRAPDLLIRFLKYLYSRILNRGSGSRRGLPWQAAPQQSSEDLGQAMDLQAVVAGEANAAKAVPAAVTSV